MAFSLVITATSSADDADSAVTGAVDTTGAELIEISAGWYPGTTTDVTVSDSKGNTWVPVYASGANPETGLVAANKWYCLTTPTVGSGHTFTVSGIGTFPIISVQAWSATSPTFDEENSSVMFNSGGTHTSIQPGTLSPSKNGALVTASVCTVGTAHSIGSGYTAFHAVNTVGGVTMGGLAAYVVQSMASAVNPTMSWTTNSDAAAVAACYVENVDSAFKSRIAGGLVVRHG